jgi:hypothetical protein
VRDTVVLNEQVPPQHRKHLGVCEACGCKRSETVVPSKVGIGIAVVIKCSRVNGGKTDIFPKTGIDDLKKCPNIKKHIKQKKHAVDRRKCTNERPNKGIERRTVHKSVSTH